MRLMDYAWKKCRVIFKNDKIAEGNIDYTSDEDNDNEGEYLTVYDTNTGKLIAFAEADIKSIEIIE